MKTARKYPRVAFLTLFVVPLLFAFLVTQGHAGEDLGQFCWNFGGGIVDRLRLSVTQANGHHIGEHVSENMFEVGAKLQAFSYQLIGSGTIVDSYPTQGMYTGGIHLSNRSSSFGGNRNCVADISLNPADGPNFLNGTWMITCVGTATPFSNSGSLIYDPGCQGPPETTGFSAQNFGYTSRESGDPR